MTITAQNKNPPKIGKTPEGQVASETPLTVMPSPISSWGSAIYWLGDPGERYGQLLPSDRVSPGVKKRMITDEVLAMSLGYISSKLVKAEYEIQCSDPDQKAFFEAMYAAFHREFMLQAAMAVAFGSCGLIKKFEFEVPDPINEGDPEVWDDDTTPFIIVGFEQVDPVGAHPKYTEDHRYDGFSYRSGDVDRVYSLWITIRRAWVLAIIWAMAVLTQHTTPGGLVNLAAIKWLCIFSDSLIAW